MKAAAVLLFNFIMYLAFGSLVCIRKRSDWSLPQTIAVGFFAYYAVFALFSIPVMLTYRPLSLLTSIWCIPCGAVLVISCVLFGRRWLQKLQSIAGSVGKNRYFWIAVVLICAATTALTVITYSFTLDAAYYVAQVATNVDTNMINVYDPFTGNWQDHFELRYVFATYYANDAVICSLTHLPALVQTKGVMCATVMLIVNILYVHICGYFFKDHARALLMYAFMTLTNLMFISIYTAPNFLMTRTYEGKTIVGNISVILIFLLYMMLVKNGGEKGIFLKLFIVCLGTATVSSTANMVIPAQVCILFFPYALLHRKPSVLVRSLACIVPEIAMMLMYVLYVKGYFAIYTFPR